RPAARHAGRARRQRTPGRAGEIRRDLQGGGRPDRVPPLSGQRARMGGEARRADRPRAGDGEILHREERTRDLRLGARCALLAFLGGCASAQWTNDRGEIATRETLSACSQQSMARADSEALASGTYVSAQSNMGARTGRTEFPRSQVPPPNTG